MKRLLRDEKGATVVELALALPVIILLFYGIFIAGLIYEANASLHHSLGQGARQATLHTTPSDESLVTTMTDAQFPMAFGEFGDPVVDSSVAFQRTLTVSYSVTPNLIFFTMPPVNISRSKLVRTIAE